MSHCIFFTYKHELCVNNTKSLVIIESKQQPRDISVTKIHPPRPPAQKLLTNQRSIPTEGKIKRRTSRDSVPDVYKT